MSDIKPEINSTTVVSGHVESSSTRDVPRGSARVGRALRLSEDHSDLEGCAWADALVLFVMGERAECRIRLAKSLRTKPHTKGEEVEEHVTEEAKKARN